MNTINDTNFNFPNQKSIYKGKVREVYNINDDLLVMIATDRLSAFDVIMPRQIPYKGQILNQIALMMLENTRRYRSKLADHFSGCQCVCGKIVQAI